jgi:hypothetical protein
MTYERLTGKNEPEGRIASDSGEESGSDNFQN